MTRQMLRQRAPRLSVFGGLLATVGTVTGAIFSAALLFEWAEREAGTSEATMIAILEVVEGRVFPVLVLFGIFFPISLLLLSVGLSDRRGAEMGGGAAGNRRDYLPGRPYR